MKVELKPFIELLRRLSKSKFDQMIMVNRTIMQCYDIGIDTDIGMHYVMLVPNTESYNSEFYDEFLVINPKEILSTYNEGHKVLLEEKKTQGAKPKEVEEEFYFHIEKEKAIFEFAYRVKDVTVKNLTISVPYPVNENSSMIDNCISSYTSLIERIKPGGSCVILDGNYYNLMQISMDCPEIFYQRIKLNGVKIKIPIIKSMFLGTKSWDDFYISIQESNIKNIYILSYQLTNKGISEQFFGYLQNF